MTPKEKAEQLVNKFILHTERYIDGWIESDLQAAKVCALIVVNEILMANPHSNPFYPDVQSTMGFWNGVRAEIENL